MRTHFYREHIMNILKQHHLLSIKEINQKIPKANFSTIFRNIEQLHNENLIKRIMIDKDTILYELADHTHDHFVCNDCGEIQKINVLKKIKTNKLTISDVMVRGLCGSCN